MALMSTVDFDMLERACEVDDKQACGSGQDVPVVVKHRWRERKWKLFEFGVKRAHVNDKAAACAPGLFNDKQRTEGGSEVLGKTFANDTSLQHELKLARDPGAVFIGGLEMVWKAHIVDTEGCIRGRKEGESVPLFHNAESTSGSIRVEDRVCPAPDVEPSPQGTNLNGDILSGPCTEICCRGNLSGWSTEQVRRVLKPTNGSGDIGRFLDWHCWYRILEGGIGGRRVPCGSKRQPSSSFYRRILVYKCCLS